MADEPLKVLAVVGSLNRTSVTKSVVSLAARELSDAGCSVDILDFLKEPLELFNPDTSFSGPTYEALKRRVDAADVLLLGTPDYHGSMSSAMKSFLDHFWHEFAGKLFVLMVASHEKGLTVIDQLRTVARQCYAWTLPYGVSFSEHDVKNDEILNETLRRRLEMTVRDARVYGRLLADQRRADLASDEPGFMAKHRKP